MKKTASCKKATITRLELLADWPEKYFSGQSAGRNSTTSETGSVRVSSQGLSSSWSKLSSENIASSRLVAPGFPRMEHYLLLVARGFAYHARTRTTPRLCRVLLCVLSQEFSSKREIARSVQVQYRRVILQKQRQIYRIFITCMSSTEVF